MYIELSYVIYLAISLSVTVWVAQTLSRNGRVFLLDAFHANPELADSVNHLLVVGFYLINVGYVALALATSQFISNTRQAIELVSSKIGVVLVVLGVMHFFNMWVLNRLRMKARHRTSPPQLPANWADNAPIGKVLD